MQSYSVSASTVPVSGARLSCRAPLLSWSMRCTVLALLATTSIAAFAQSTYVTPSDEFRKRIDQQSVAPLGDSIFGADTSLYSGATEFSAVDIDVPGNSALPVRFGRRFVIEDRKQMGYISGLDDWDVDLPHIETTASEQGWMVLGYNHPDRYNRCTTLIPPLTGNSLITVEQAWGGYQLHLPGQGDQELMKAIPGAFSAPSDGGQYPWVTSANVRLSCLSSLQNGHPGQGFMALMPDGVRYWFNWMIEREAPTMRKAGPQMAAAALRKRYFLLATRVEDRFGNWVTYSYSGDKLTSIAANDGRAITLAYANGKVSTATAHGRTWTYQYGTGGLSAVIQPDGARWSFEKTGSLVSNKPGDPSVLPVDTWEPQCLESDPALLGPFRYVITHPGGARGDFQFGLARHYRSTVPWTCQWEYPPFDKVTLPSEVGSSQVVRDVLFLMSRGMPFHLAKSAVPGAEEAFQQMSGITIEHFIGQDELRVPNYFDVLALTSRKVTGPAIAEQTTSYHYGEVSPLGFCYPGSGCAGQEEAKWVTVTHPDGTKDKYRYGVQYAINEGRLLETAKAKPDDAVVSSTSSIYMSSQEVAQQPFAPRVGEALRDIPMVSYVHPQVSTITLLDGVTYSSTVDSFDALARPVSVTRSSNISYGYTRTDVTSYHDNLSKWVLGQVASISTAGLVPTQTEYDATTALPIRTYAFGTLTQTTTYNADGTMATVKDGNNNLTTVSDWKRGIPRTVRHPATPESPSGATQTVVVDDHGWISSTTDENGYATQYGYDSMGRLSSVAYPVDDSVLWNNTITSFVQVNQAEMGVPAGHWRQIVQQGNYEKLTLFDALLRPVLQYERDISNNDQTYRIVANAYDTAGRQIFASYPRNPYADGNWSIGSSGTHTFYDTLGRVVKVQQDSELGAPVTTTTEYLTGGDIKVVNPRGKVTRTRYAAWDQPTTDYPIEIFHPEGAFTQIVRDAMLRPIQTRRTEVAP
ncbi:hypothetical protein LVB77_00635 [Lysobacter sp. 5GHs7-4]|uniref:RHS repeat domain-containing protein n=1 Tax=Lysobacter sp. 5GHs7-4 TaxID=2904253 RepID=UPI001E3DE16C|nr:RHS repeat domain-containing protein [Lysobacter sp. 5GHs7-4]UHQ23253.1 hypothetical protein LVB77_00635 [Lysobacter sp. 5GHs7-4]